MIISAFTILVLMNVALRIVAKARKARSLPRGEVHQPGLLNQMILGYLGIVFAAVIEQRLRFWTFHGILEAGGLTLYAAAAALQWRAFKDLGSAYSPDIEVRAQQPLVREGLYAWVRHPLLLALIVELFGVTLFLNAYLSAGAVVLAFIPLVRRRLREEEKVLQIHFGDAYRQYSQQVGGLFPKLFLNPKNPLGGLHHDTHA